MNPVSSIARQALCGCLVVAILSGCGGGDGSSGSSDGGAIIPKQADPVALTPSGDGVLVAWVKERLRARIQRDATVVFDSGDRVFLAVPTMDTGESTGSAPRSGTPLQEVGVDEDDLLKTDGDQLYTLSPGQLTGEPGAFARLDAYSGLLQGNLTVAGRLSLAQPVDATIQVRGMLLAGQAARLAVIGESFGALDGAPDCPPDLACVAPVIGEPESLGTTVHLLDVASPQAIRLAGRYRIDGRLVGSRRIGNVLYLATVHQPVLALDRLPATATEAERYQAVDGLVASDLLPRFTRDDGDSRVLLGESECYVQVDNASFDIQVTTVIALDLSQPDARPTAQCVVGGAEALYMSASALYLATSRYPAVQTQSGLRYDSQARTDIHKFAVNGSRVEYRGSGEVAGHLGWDRERAAYRMSEYAGNLRVVTFTGEIGWATLIDASFSGIPPSPATLTILRETVTGPGLTAVSALPNPKRPESIGLPGEQVYGVRFVGERAYVVTFRQTDPVYVLDLADPLDPRVAGELKMPGFSDYLYPLDNGLLVGVGKDATVDGELGGVKLALIDVANPARPALLATRVWGDRGSVSGLDFSRHGIDILDTGGRARIALPIGVFNALDGSIQQGLQRVEVDTVSRTLSTRPLLTVLPKGWFDIASDRSVQVGNRLYWFTQGQTRVFDW
jgi:hypothetical protein